MLKNLNSMTVICGPHYVPHSLKEESDRDVLSVTTISKRCSNEIPALEAERLTCAPYRSILPCSHESNSYQQRPGHHSLAHSK